MPSPMPPLNALRACEAAARHLSLTRAAEELHVTAGALSHQIRGLEDFLGVKLFERRVRAIALTPAGKLLYVPQLEGPMWTVVNAMTGAVITRIETKSGSHNTIYADDGSRVYLAGLK